MKRIFFLFFLILNSINSLGFNLENINDYRDFSRGKEYFEDENYKDALTEFEILEKKYPYSPLFKSNYANYYIGMTQYKLENYNQARNFLERAIYIPKDLETIDSYLKEPKKHFFEYERNYYLGKIYLKQGLTEEALKHFKFLIKNYYSPNLETYEKLAFKELMKYEPYYKTLYRVKYKGDLSLLSSIRDEDILSLGDFFFSRGMYSSAEKVYSHCLSIKKGDTRKIKLSLLESIKREKKYEELINRSLELRESEEGDINDFHYYTAMGYMQTAKIKKSEEYFAKVIEGKYKETAIIERVRLYSQNKNYAGAISLLKDIHSEKAHRILMETYLKAGMEENFKRESIDYIKKYPHSDQAAYYRFLLYKESKNPNYLNWIIKYNFNSYYYEIAYSITENLRTLEKYPLDYKKSLYKKQIKRLESLAQLKDGEVLKIELANLSFPEKDSVFKEYLISKAYEKEGLYLYGILNSRKHQDDFSMYSNLIPMLYPKYYNAAVKRAAKKYDVEEALIYSVILEESTFDPSLLSPSGGCGLMQVKLSTSRETYPEITLEDLLSPEVNIDLGAVHLRKLLNRFNGDIGKTLVSYKTGTDNVTKWPSDKKGYLDIEKIPSYETREYVKRTLNNYYKYKRIYYN